MLNNVPDFQKDPQYRCVLSKFEKEQSKYLQIIISGLKVVGGNYKLIKVKPQLLSLSVCIQQCGTVKICEIKREFSNNL